MVMTLTSRSVARRRIEGRASPGFRRPAAISRVMAAVTCS
jgi:hypothetical protein